MNTKSVLGVLSVFLMATTISGCVGQMLLDSAAQASLDSETPESEGETAAHYRGKSCLELAIDRNAAMTSVRHTGEHSSYVQKHGYWKLAAVEQVEREQGCLAGTTIDQAGDIDYVSKHPESAKEFNLPPGALKAAPSTVVPLPASTNAIIGQAPSTPPQSTRGWLGVYFQEAALKPKLAKALGMNSLRGVMIIGAAAGGAGEMAGLKSLDVILAADDRTFDQTDTLIAYVATLPAGHPLKLKLWRNGSEQTLSVTLGTVAPPTDFASGAPGYCYVSLPSGSAEILGWRSSLFPVPARTPAELQAAGVQVGNQFRAFVLTQVPASQVGAKGYGICNAGAGGVDSILQAEISAQKNSAIYQSSGAETVDLVWRP